jgi:Cellulase (glycosyl hydrolase family 5).
VRNSGGNNGNRYLIIPSYAASIDEIPLFGMEVPSDGRIAVSLHFYYPRGFCSDQFTDESVWTEKDREKLKKKFSFIAEMFVAKGIPVVIGEFGAAFKNNDAERAEFIRDFLSLAAKSGIPCLWWDDGAGNYGLMDRLTGEWTHGEAVEALTNDQPAA